MMLVMRRWVAPQASSQRQMIAGLLLLVAMYYLLLPGPWMPYRWIYQPFAIGTSAVSATVARELRTAEPQRLGPKFGLDETREVAQAVSPTIELPQVLHSTKFWEIIFWIKWHSRWLLHFAIFASIATVLTAILQSPRVAVFAAGMAIATEALETLLGFGFDGDDVIDLVAEGLGIWFGVRVTLATYARWARHCDACRKGNQKD